MLSKQGRTSLLSCNPLRQLLSCPIWWCYTYTGCWCVTSMRRPSLRPYHNHRTGERRTTITIPHYFHYHTSANNKTPMKHMTSRHAPHLGWWVCREMLQSKLHRLHHLEGLGVDEHEKGQAWSWRILCVRTRGVRKKRAWREKRFGRNGFSGRPEPAKLQFCASVQKRATFPFWSWLEANLCNRYFVCNMLSVIVIGCERGSWWHVTQECPQWTLLWAEVEIATSTPVVLSDCCEC